jgi:hypothetical protein
MPSPCRETPAMRDYRWQTLSTVRAGHRRYTRFTPRPVTLGGLKGAF